jgi:hypothetical protein
MEFGVWSVAPNVIREKLFNEFSSKLLVVGVVRNKALHFTRFHAAAVVDGFDCRH